MGQGERIEILSPCPLTPSLKRSLKPQGIKKSLNLNLKSITIFAAVSLIVILTTALVASWISFEHYMGTPIDVPPVAEHFNGLMVHPGFWLFVFIEIIILGAGWKMFSEIREYNKTKTS
ncbi:MAG: hypothetical protein ACFFDM_07260 [Candidatus Thorarchaeota archaeon]